ncbi:MAG: hypothetical protein M1835_000492 [Candelina submexicana]|nr:MAG: hypothetical protein M1835_000492 [Candelina submexicana]
MPRLVRRRPLAERIKAYLNPLDFLLWLSEGFDSNDWDQFQQDWATPIGAGINIVFLIARASSGNGGKKTGDDVFGDETSGTGWLSWFCSFIVHMLTLLSLINAYYTFYRKRRYRLFENPVDAPPSTPSAHRVHANTDPMSSSPLRFLSRMIESTSAEARSHPDPTRDVWELAVWDPTRLCLRLFCLFSPGHVLVYWLFLPTAAQDPRPSTTVVTAMVLGAILSTQMMFLQSSFSQQTKDTAVIHKEVFHEYDTKYVHPRLNPQVRDVGTQYSDSSTTTNGWSNEYEDEDNTVETHTPTVIINRGFVANPNPNYNKHTDPHGYGQHPTTRGISSTHASFQTPTYTRDATPARSRTTIWQSGFRNSTGGDGGSLGVYTHAQSPLRKTASTNFLGPSAERSGGLNRSHNGYHDGKERSKSPSKMEGSPLKKSSVPGGHDALPNGTRFTNFGGTARRETGRF